MYSFERSTANTASRSTLGIAMLLRQKKIVATFVLKVLSLGIH